MTGGVIIYGGSQRGRSHVKSEKPCQDSSYIGVINEELSLVLMIVADGVGSALHSEEGSKIAVDKVREHLEGTKPPITVEKIKDAYTLAFEEIKRHSADNSGSISDYDTTLTTAIFNVKEGSVTYGHSGDGAILGIRKDGINESITQPQKGSEVNSVIPLRDTKSWEFGVSQGPYVSVMLMTDGILDILMPGILRMTSEPIYTRLTSWLADLKFFDKELPLQDQCNQRIDYIRSDRHSGITNDDLTFICAINEEELADYRGDDYYKEPDWSALKKEWNKLAYPSLYSKPKHHNIPVGDGKKSVGIKRLRYHNNRRAGRKNERRKKKR